MHHLKATYIIFPFDMDYDRTIFENMESEGLKNLNIEKITFKLSS